MSREEVKQEVLGIPNSNILLELPTSFGKSKCGLDIMASRNPKGRILIVVPRLVLIENWKEEIQKWGYERYLPQVEFSTYVSLPKRADKYDFIIFDEVQHLSERCQDSLGDFTINNAVLLSATVTNYFKQDLKLVFRDLYCYKVSMKEAIREEVLPDPKVFLIPLKLDWQHTGYTIVKNPKGPSPIIKVDYLKRWEVLRAKKKNRIEISCSQTEYYKDLDESISYWKMKTFRTGSASIRNRWLHLCNIRLRWLSEEKDTHIKRLLNILSKERTLTFCNSIEQTEELGKYTINSKDKKESLKNLDKFNRGEINHITACDMLNEGMNLVNCRVGIYANLHSSEIITKQRLGRILRHESPIIIIPYFEGTREEEIMKKMLEDYNPKLVEKITLNDLKIWSQSV